MLIKKQFRIINRVIWDKPNPRPTLGTRKRLKFSHDVIYWFDRGTTDQITTYVQDVRQPVQLSIKYHKSLPDVPTKITPTKPLEDVWTVAPDHNDTTCTGKLPLALTYTCVRLSVPPHGTALDAFGGTHTIRQACELAGRKSITFDLRTRESYMKSLLSDRTLDVLYADYNTSLAASSPSPSPPSKRTRNRQRARLSAHTMPAATSPPAAGVTNHQARSSLPAGPDTLHHHHSSDLQRQLTHATDALPQYPLPSVIDHHTGCSVEGDHQADPILLSVCGHSAGPIAVPAPSKVVPPAPVLTVRPAELPRDCCNGCMMGTTTCQPLGARNDLPVAASCNSVGAPAPASQVMAPTVLPAATPIVRSTADERRRHRSYYQYLHATGHRDELESRKLHKAAKRLQDLPLGYHSSGQHLFDPPLSSTRNVHTSQGRAPSDWHVVERVLANGPTEWCARAEPANFSSRLYDPRSATYLFDLHAASPLGDSLCQAHAISHIQLVVRPYNHADPSANIYCTIGDADLPLPLVPQFANHYYAKCNLHRLNMPGLPRVHLNNSLIINCNYDQGDWLHKTLLASTQSYYHDLCNKDITFRKAHDVYAIALRRLRNKIPTSIYRENLVAQSILNHNYNKSSRTIQAELDENKYIRAHGIHMSTDSYFQFSPDVTDATLSALRTHVFHINRTPDAALPRPLPPAQSFSATVATPSVSTTSPATPQQIPMATPPADPSDTAWDSIVCDADNDACKTIKAALKQHSKFFTKSLRLNVDGTMSIPGAEHVIDTGDMRPLRQRDHRRAPATNEIIDRQVQQWLEQGVIQRSNSPWSNPIVAAVKKGGAPDEKRICLDFRIINKHTKPDAYPLPNIPELLTEAAGSKYYVKFDCIGGYHQINIRAEDRPKTAFQTRNGFWEFITMPFGLRNAGATFQRCMDTILGPLRAAGIPVLWYVDDVLIHADTIEELTHATVRVVEALANANVYLKASKTILAHTHVEFLGHAVSKDGIAIPQSRIDAVLKIPTPTSAADIRCFLGVTGYAQPHLQDYAAIVQPLRDLQKQALLTLPKETSDLSHLWGPTHEHAFQTLKQIITSAPVLAPFRPDRKTILRTDACTTTNTIACVLSQMVTDDDGVEREHPVIFAGRGLLPAEKNYSVTEKEALAIVWAVTVKLQHLLAGTPFTIETDHKALSWMKTVKDPTGRLTRWALKLQPFDYEIRYIPGSTNPSDGITRIRGGLEPPPPTDLENDDLHDHAFPITTLPDSSSPAVSDLFKLRAQQHLDYITRRRAEDSSITATTAHFKTDMTEDDISRVILDIPGYYIVPTIFSQLYPSFSPHLFVATRSGKSTTAQPPAAQPLADTLDDDADDDDAQPYDDSDPTNPFPDDGDASDDTDPQVTYNFMTLNVNGMRSATTKIKSQLNMSMNEFLDKHSIHIACFQEIKHTPQLLASEKLLPTGGQFYHSPATTTEPNRKHQAGVATWVRASSPFAITSFRNHLIVDHPLNAEGRVLFTDHTHFVLYNVYIPCITNETDARMELKTTFLRALRAEANDLHASGRRVIFTGDFNIAAGPNDVVDIQWDQHLLPGIFHSDIKMMTDFLSPPPDARHLHLVDVPRKLYPTSLMFTVSKPYKMRLDYWIADSDTANYFLEEYAPQYDISDHRPDIITIKIPLQDEISVIPEPPLLPAERLSPDVTEIIATRSQIPSDVFYTLKQEIISAQDEIDKLRLIKKLLLKSVFTDVDINSAVYEQAKDDMHNYDVKDNVLLVKHTSNKIQQLLIVIPSSLQQSILRRAHDDAHRAIKHTWERIKDAYWWPTRYVDVVWWVSSCIPCQLYKTHGSKRQHVMRNFFIPQRPWQCLCMDYMHVLLKDQPHGYKYLLIVVDQFTKFLLIIPTKDMTAETTARALNVRVFAPLGSPESIRSDNASMFTGKYMQQLNDIFQIKQIPTVANAPHSNGQAERYVQIVSNSLRTLMHKYEGTADIFMDALAKIASVTNATPNRMTGESAFYMLFTRRPRSVLSEMHRLLTTSPATPPAQLAHDHISNYLRLAIQMQRELTVHAIQQLRISRQKMISDYNKDHKAFQPEVGDIIMINFERARYRRDVSPLFVWRSIGPFMIIGSTGNVVYVCDWRGQPHRRPVHVIHCRRTVPREDQLFDEARSIHIPQQSIEYDDEDSPALVDVPFHAPAYAPNAIKFVKPLPADSRLADTVDDLQLFHDNTEEDIPPDDSKWEQL